MACRPLETHATGPLGLSSVRLPAPGIRLIRRSLGPGLAMAMVVAASSTGASLAGNSSEAPRLGVPAVSESDAGSLLVEYHEKFLGDRDVESFRQQVSARYTEGTLARLAESGPLKSRQAAVRALGLFGTFESNAVVARALRDSDPSVRALADNALWGIWFRADTPENNAMLEQVQLLIRHDRLADAVKLATHLIARAPHFAEAYNQRAIAHFVQGHYEASAEDCKRALDRNPYHIGALGGLAQCQVELDQRHEALKTYQRLLRLQPFNTRLREFVSALEAGGD